MLSAFFNLLIFNFRGLKRLDRSTEDENEILIKNIFFSAKEQAVRCETFHRNL